MKLYLIRNKEGKYFHRKGLSGYGSSWRGEIESARIYNKLATARSQVTYWYKKYPEYGAPDIVVYECIEIEVIDEQARIDEIVKKNKERDHKNELKAIERAYNDAKERYETLKEYMGK